MREILFRGKRIATDKWIEGSLLDYGDGDFDICGPSDEPNDLFKYCVDPNTVGQYTGLKDKNGKKIFEGDLLRFDSGDGETSIYRIFWDHHRWLVAWIECSHVDPDDLDELFCSYAEVIGNIHDNPELFGCADNG